MNFQNKLTDFEEKLERLFENVDSLSMDIKLKGMVKQNNHLDSGSLGNYNNNNNVNFKNTETISVSVELMEMKLKFDHLVKDFDLIKKTFKTQQLPQQQNHNGNHPGEKKEKSKIKDNNSSVKTDDIQRINEKVDEIYDQITLLKERNLVFDFNLEAKISKDDIERLNKQHTLELEKLQIKMVETIKSSDKNKNSNDNYSNNSNNAFDKVELVRIILC